MPLPRIPIALALLAAAVSAQSFNLRYTNWSPLPSPTFGAATGQAGVWNAIETPFPYTGTAVVTPLVDLAGAATTVRASMKGCDASSCFLQGYGDDVQNLFAGAPNGDCFGDFSSTTLEGLLAGRYVMTAYSRGCSPFFHYLKVTAPTVVLLDSVGGKFQGSFESMDLGAFGFTLVPGADVVISPASADGFYAALYGYMSALQIAKIEPPAVYCTSKVNSQGCTAKIAAIGNEASLSGVQPFHVVATDVVNDVPGLLFYGFAADVKPFVGGWHCVKPPTPRTGGQFSGGNGVPCAGTFDLDFNAWLGTDPLPKVYAGARIHAQYWYRDVNDPFGSATSDAVSFHVVQ